MIRGNKIATIENFEDYQICETGTVYSLVQQFYHSGTGGELSVRIDRGGYKTVRLSNNGTTSTKLVHRLLGQSFIPNPFNLPEINHNDGNKLNIALHNLEWTTHAQNVSHAYASGLYKNSTAKNRKVIDTLSGRVFKSAKDASMAYGIPYSTCKNYLNGKRSNPTNLRYVDATPNLENGL
jgi:hypothetical protein